MSSSSLLLRAQELDEQLRRHQLMQLTAEQTCKDFAMSGIPFMFSEEAAPPYAIMHAQLVGQIQHLLKTSRSKLVALLYRIDLSEEEIRNGVQYLQPYDYIEAMAHLILVREFQKVCRRLNLM